MSEQGKERLESICETLKKATPSQREFVMGFAEGIAYASGNNEEPDAEKE